MDDTVQSLITAGVSPNTMRTYRSALSRFLAFCRQSGLTPFPLTQVNLCRFVAYLYNTHLAPSSVRLYLSALRFFHINLLGTDPSLPDMARLHYTVRGLSRLQPASNRPTRLPITLDILETLFRVWSAESPTYDRVMLWAACSLGFFAFLRAGEFTVTSGTPHQTVLAPSDIQVDSTSNPTYLTVNLRTSKTDPFGQGCTLYIGKTDSRTCPVTAILAYLSLRSSAAGPLFIHEDGTPLLRSELVSAVRSALTSAGLEVSRFTGHSFRIGAATSAALAGLPDSLIQTLGRWKSSSFLRYIRTPPQTLLGISQRIMSSTQSP